MRSLLLVIGLFLSQSAFAGFVFEPTAGFVSGALNGTLTSGGTLATMSYSGLGVGARLGYSWGGSFWIAGEGSYTLGKGSATANTGTTNYDVTDTNIGLLVGYDSSKWRFYGGYMPSSSFVMKDTTTTISSLAETTITGSALKIGVGYFIKPRFSVSVEVLSHTFSKYKVANAEVDTADLFKSIKNDPVAMTLGYLF